MTSKSPVGLGGPITLMIKKQVLVASQPCWRWTTLKCEIHEPWINIGDHTRDGQPTTPGTLAQCVVAVVKMKKRVYVPEPHLCMCNAVFCKCIMGNIYTHEYNE